MIVDLRNELLQDMITLNRNINIVIRRLTPPVLLRPIATTPSPADPMEVDVVTATPSEVLPMKGTPASNDDGAGRAWSHLPAGRPQRIEGGEGQVAKPDFGSLKACHGRPQPIPSVELRAARPAGLVLPRPSAKMRRAGPP